jgi:hypothetical protein
MGAAEAIMLKPLRDFQPFETHHCITGSMRHIYEFHRYAISEDLLLGLGAGVGFVYWHMKGTMPFLGGRANVGRPGEEGLEKTAGKRTGVRVERFQTESGRKAEKAMLELLLAGEPVMVYVDMGFLPYLHFPKKYHFGGHAVVVAGCGTEVQGVLVADRDGELHRLLVKELMRARSSKFKPFPPRNTWYSFDFDDKRPPKPEELRQAIREVVTGMLRPPIANLGVKGIRTAAARVRLWPKLMDKEQLRYACFNAFIFIDATGGTGGGLFRYMYARFLSEAEGVLGDGRLADVSKQLRRIGDLWQSAAHVFKGAAAASDPSFLLPEAAALLLKIADGEQTAWEKLDPLD